MSLAKKSIKHIVLWKYLPLRSRKKIKACLRIFQSKNNTPYSNLFQKFATSNVDFSHYEVAVYFNGNMSMKYQIEQWIEVLKFLDKTKKVLFIVRNKAVFTYLTHNTDFNIVYCLTIQELTQFYEKNNLKCILYVNNNVKNFQSLLAGDVLHVHINHGESDKTSTTTNQSKAYDYVFIVSEAGYDKYKDNLINVDMTKFIKIGRPQLEHITSISPLKDKMHTGIPAYKNSNNISNEKKIILYAPTWEGTYDSMNFSSLGDFGLNLVNELLADSNYYLVYKPHPSTGSRLKNINIINNEIQRRIDNHCDGKVIRNADINSLYPQIDLAIFDNSAIAIDYLPLNKPMLMTDMFYKIESFQKESMITHAARMLSSEDINNILFILGEELEYDTLKVKRNVVKKYFLGNYDYSHNESTQNFVDKVSDICDERDSLVNKLLDHNNNKKSLFG